MRFRTKNNIRLTETAGGAAAWKRRAPAEKSALPLHIPRIESYYTNDCIITTQFARSLHN